MAEKYPSEVYLVFADGMLKECNPSNGVRYVPGYKYKSLEMKISQLQYYRERHLETIDQLQNEVATLKQQKDKT